MPENLLAGERPVVIVDMDGTIADASRREKKFLRGEVKDWTGFFSDMESDPPITSVIDHVKHLARKYDIVILTGRPDKYRQPSEAWLRKHEVPFTKLLMRRQGDKRPDYTAKTHLLEELRGRKIVLAIDDRGPVCDEYRKLGIKCVQIASDAENQLVNEAYQLLAE